MHINKEISWLRKEKKWTQTELAKASGLSLPTIQLIESGRGNPSWETLQKILDALKVRIRFEKVHLQFGLSQYLEGELELSSGRLAEEIKYSLALLHLKQLTERDFDIFIACLSALRAHYPSWLNELNLSREIATLFSVNQKKINPNRLIKLRRLWLSRLSEVL